jgi:hypothetical protein
LTLKPRTNFILTTLQKEQIKENLIRSRNVLTIIPEIVDPDFEYITMIGRIAYDPNRTSRTADEILTLVKAAISDYNDAELKRFDSTFRKSKLQSYIENAERSITGSDIQVYLQKRQILNFGVAENLRIRFNVPLRKGDYISKLYTFPEAQVFDLTNILRDVFVEEVPESFTGIEQILIENPGINYTSVPNINIRGDGIGASARAKIVNGRISEITVVDKGSNYSRAEIVIEGGGGTEATATPVLEARNGTLRTFYFKDNGEKVIINDNAGTIDYNTGEVFLQSFNVQSLVENDFYLNDVLTFNIPSQSEIILPLRNRIISIDEGDPFAIQLRVEAE